ncbi:hypothetical protein AB833_30750 [Chromatiales bacterium (ex Bugula neritina AB1)]|nr:hypothetical protein AB833_30750 [Chromatiales bacterium (ex Bugula neritina AB1)]
MTKIQFYILASDDLEQRWSYAKQLLLQTLMRGKSVHIHTSCAAHTRLLMEKLSGSLGDNDEKVSIDHKGEPDLNQQVLLNLSNEVPHFFSSFETTLEVVHAENNTRIMGRERYRYYQQRGYPLRHFEIQPELALG